jgi:hypothetical protein
MDIKRIGVGRLNDEGLGNNVIIPMPGIFTFDSTTVRFDSTVDTFDFDIVPLVGNQDPDN